MIFFKPLFEKLKTAFIFTPALIKPRRTTPMDSKNEARYSSLLETQTFCDQAANILIWSADTSFTNDYTTFKGKVTAIGTQLQKAAAVTIGYTTDKANKEGALITDLIFVGPRIETWASPSNNNNPAVAAAAKMSESDLHEMKDSDLLIKAQSIDALITANPTIVPAFITLLRRTAFTGKITAYAGVVEMPEDKIDERATAHAAAVEGIRDTVEFRKTELARDVKVFRESNPDFFNSFNQTMKIDGNPTQHFAVNGDAKDFTTGEAIPNVTVLIAQLGLIVKTGPKGNFQFKTVPAGQYTIVFSKFGFETVQQTLYVNAGERTEVHARMNNLQQQPT